MIAKRLKEDRTRLGWTQDKMAEVAGCTRRTVVEWESEEGDSSPKASQLEKLAERGMDVYYVLTGQRVGSVTTLSARESALVENYRASPEDAKRVLEKTGAYLAQSPGALKRSG